MSKNNEQVKIGRAIARQRKQMRMTQEALATALKTSQSAVARMEKGEQNFSTEMLSKIGRVLHKDIILLSGGAVNFKVNGGRKLAGTVRTNISKNSAVALLCASLLNKNKTILKRIPRIEEVRRVIEVLVSIGVSVRWINDGEDVEITPPAQINIKNFDVDAAIRTRSILLLLGPLAHLMEKFSIPQSGGCKLGSRTVRPHFLALSELGIRVQSTKGSHDVSVRALHPAHIVLYESGDTVTENAIMAAAKIPGKTVIQFASANYQVQDLCDFLVKLGVQIEGIGTTTLAVHGVTDIDIPITYYPSEDPIESMLFLSVAATTNSSITIERCPIDFLALELLKLKTMGFKYKIIRRYKADNEWTDLVDIQTYPSVLRALDEHIHPSSYPGLNIDNLPFFVPIATQAKGRTFVHDWVYEDRALYYTELRKLGADVVLADPHRLYVTGPTKLVAAEVVCPPALRPAAIILVAMLAAPGTSILRNVYSILRGYEDIALRLRSIGADIQMLQEL